MSTLPSLVTPTTDQLGPEQEPDKAKKKLWKDLRSQADACKSYRRKLVQGWTSNIDYRRGKPFASQTDEDRVAVNIDWSLTKAKQALLFSQVPAIRINHPPQTLSLPWVHSFEQKVNDTIVTAGIETAMDEVLPDCINAAGIGVVLVSYEALTEDVQIPAIDMATMPPELRDMTMKSGVMPEGTPVPMTVAPRITDARYLISRVSPGDFLWPITFTGSDFDTAPWVGRTGRISWAEASKRFKLDPTEKDSIVGEDRATMDRLTHDVEKDKESCDTVSFDEIFYREYQHDAESKSYSAIHHVIFVTGKDDPVIDEAWKGQKVDEETQKVIGALKFPLRVLTLTYITDESIPPSDTAIGRTQVNELNKSRTQMVMQRERSLPIRWADSNRIDPTILQAMMRGTWQAIIPVQGQGTNVIGEVGRANMPMENFKFDQIAKDDLLQAWQIGPSGTGSDVETKGESNDLVNTMQTRIGRERAKVGKFFCSIAEVIGGLICINEDPSAFGEGFKSAFSAALAYSILADSTLLLDSNQRLDRLIKFVNFAGKSGWLNLEPVLKEIATLSGCDPAVVIQPPQPKPPAEPNISLRLTGTEDMLNPLTLAFLMKSGQAPSTDLIEQAKQLIQSAVTPPPNAMIPPPPPPQIDPETGQPIPQAEGGPGGPGGPPVPIPTPIAPPIPVNSPAPPVTQSGEAHPNWHAMPRINQRVVERGGDK